MLFQNRLLTRAAPVQSHDRKGVVSATNAQHHAVEGLARSAAAILKGSGLQPVRHLSGVRARYQLAGRRGDVAPGHPRHPAGLPARARRRGGAPLGGRSLRPRKFHRPRHPLHRPKGPGRQTGLRRHAAARAFRRRDSAPECVRRRLARLARGHPRAHRL